MNITARWAENGKRLDLFHPHVYLLYTALHSLKALHKFIHTHFTSKFEISGAGIGQESRQITPA